MGLFTAYFTHGLNPGAQDVLLRIATQVGLDPVRASAVLQSEAYATEVREAEALITRQGIRSVPAVILNDQYLISGGQPLEGNRLDPPRKILVIFRKLHCAPSKKTLPQA